MKTLAEARVEIDQIDWQMAELFEARMHVVVDVVRYKKEHGLPVFDAVREAQVIEKNLMLIKDLNLRAYYTDFLLHFMDLSKKYQKTFLEFPAVGYQGTQGAFGHIASVQYFPDHPKKEFGTFKAVFDAVMNGEIQYGVIPFENSYTGEVGEALDLLKEYPLFVVDSYDLKVNHNLVGLPGTQFTDVKQVYSHQQALSQCQLFLKGRGWNEIAYANTALAAEYVMKQQDKTKAAIAAKETAVLYGLEVLAENINTASDNTTRFVIISKHQTTKGNRFSLLFTVKHDAGQLANVMQLFAAKGFNLENIKSRSVHQGPWQYYFYVEVVGSLEEEKTKQLLTEMNDICQDVRVLGSYQIDKT